MCQVLVGNGIAAGVAAWAGDTAGHDTAEVDRLVVVPTAVQSLKISAVLAGAPLGKQWRWWNLMRRRRKRRGSLASSWL